MSEAAGDEPCELSYFYGKDGHLIIEETRNPDTWLKSDTTCEEYL
jgi:hypothetical protein